MLPIPPKPSLWKKVTNVLLKTAAILDMQSQKIINLLDPVDDQDAATKKYVVDNFTASADSEEGTAQITVGNTYVDVAHTLGSSPSAYAISSDIYDGAIHYEDNADGSNFRINILVPTFNQITYKWKIWK